MEQLYPLFFELLKLCGVKNPTQDMFLPFAIALAVGYISGAIAIYMLIKISHMEKQYKRKNEEESNDVEESPEEVRRNQKGEQVTEEELNGPIVEKEVKDEQKERKEATPQNIPKEETSQKTTVAKNNEEKQNEGSVSTKKITDNEGEWKVINKKGGKKKIK